MTGLRERIERIFAAVAYAESDERESALRIAGAPAGPQRSSIEDLMVAVTFAEADCRRQALETLSPARPAVPRSVRSFAETVGLAGVPMRYGVAGIR